MSILYAVICHLGELIHIVLINAANVRALWLNIFTFLRYNNRKKR